MKSKLNLTIDHEVKLFANEYGTSHHISVSKLVEQYLRQLQKKEAQQEIAQGLEIQSSKVKALYNSLSTDIDDNWKKNRLEEKYLND